MDERREVWITGVGLVSCLGEGSRRTGIGSNVVIPLSTPRALAPYIGIRSVRSAR